jgi:hypothetical protein
MWPIGCSARATVSAMQHNTLSMPRRKLCPLTLAWLPAEAADGAAAWAALRDGAIVLLRHANVPDASDAPQFKLGDCRTRATWTMAAANRQDELAQTAATRELLLGWHKRGT